MARYATEVTSDDPRKKNIEVWGLGIFVAMRLVPCTHSIAQEELHLSSFAPLQQNELVLHPAESKPNILGGAVHSRMVPTYHSTTGDIIWCSDLLPGMLFQRVFPCISHYTVIFGLVCWWASTASWWLSCTWHMVLCEFMHPFRWKHASSLNMILSAWILCDLNHSQNWTQLSVSFPWNSCTKCIYTDEICTVALFTVHIT